MSMVKEVTEFTDGYTIDEEVAMVLANKNKHLLDYVKELSEIAITKAVYDLNKFEDYPIDFDEIFPRYLVIDTFVPLMQEYITKLDTVRSKLYLSAQNLLEPIKLCGMSIKDYGRDIEDLEDIDIATMQIGEELADLECCVDILSEIRIMLKNNNIDNGEIIKADSENFRYQYTYDDSIDFVSVYALYGKYKGYSFAWPSNLIGLYALGPNNPDNWYIELPKNLELKLSKFGEQDKFIKTFELIEDIKKDSK